MRLLRRHDNLFSRLNNANLRLGMLILHLMQEIHRSAIDGLNPDSILLILLVVDQDKHISTIPPPNRDDPMFYWIIRNIDFTR